MKKLKKIVYLCLNILLFSSYSFAQYEVGFATITYKGEEHYVVSNMVCIDIKETFYNQALLDRIKKSGYEIITAQEKYRKLLLKTDGKSDILEHYYRFEKEEYVENVLPYGALVAYYAPNDLYFQNQQQWYLYKINIPSAWDHLLGSTSVKIGVLDSGIPIDINQN